MHQVKGEYHGKLSALIRNLVGMTGNLIKYANIANDLAQDDKTVKRYMEILELMFIIHRLNPYIRNRAKRAVVGMPKLHFVDTGSYLSCRADLDTSRNILNTSHIILVMYTVPETSRMTHFVLHLCYPLHHDYSTP